MSLPSYKELPVCKRHSLKGLYGVIAEEYDLASWNSLDVSVRRSKRKVYDYLASELGLVSWYELDIPLRRSTRLLYNFIVVCADPTTPTLTVIVNGSDGVLEGATVSIGGESETTGSDGKASFELEYGDYEALISCSGYVTKTENIAFRSNHKNFTVTLESEPTPTFDGYKGIMYDEESSETPMMTTLFEATGEEENNRKEYRNYDGRFWLDDDVVVDGTTKNIAYSSSDSDSPYCYVALENVTNVSDVTVTLLDSDGEPYPQGYIAIGDLSSQTAWDYGVTDENGQITLKSLYGNFQIYYGAIPSDLEKNYEDVTIDSATETFTVQLPQQTGTVTVICMYDDAEWSDTNIYLLDGETQVAIGYSDAYGVAILTDDITITPIEEKQIPYGTYTLKGIAGTAYSYEGSLTVDSAKVTTTITLTEQ